MQHALPHLFAPFRCNLLILCLLGLWLTFPLHNQAQPRLVKDIYQDPSTGEPLGSNLRNFINVNEIVYFTADDGTHDRTLWKTDGTTHGTVKVAGGKVFGVSDLTNVNGTLYFIAGGGMGNELWRSDGTSQGTVKVSAGKAINIRELTHVNGTLFFADNSHQLWKSDGTSQGTVKLSVPLPGFSFEFQKAGNNLFFTVFNNQLKINELWKSDGTSHGTVKVAGGFSHGPYNSTGYNKMLFFVTYDSITGRNYLWKSDGTEAGTTKVAPDRITHAYSFVEAFGNLFFIGRDPVEGTEYLWKTDGTDEQTLKVAPGKFRGASNFALINNKLYFTAYDSSDTSPYSEIWTTDGTDGGTIKVVPGKAFFAHSFTDVNGVLFFNAYDPSVGGSGYELWKSNGTHEGTSLVKDIIPGWQSAYPANLLNLNGKLLFCTYDFEKDHFELWKSDGTETGTVQIIQGRSSSYPQKLTNANGSLFFTAYQPDTGEEIWKSDGTEAGTSLLKDITAGPLNTSIDQLTSANNLLFFTTNEPSSNLWKSDGTTQGTSKLVPENMLSAHSLTSTTNYVFFSANGHLWKSDGTDAGTIQLTQTPQHPYSLTQANGILFFLNSSALWKSDGTPQGTVLIKDIQLEAYRIFKMNPVHVNGTLFFATKTQDGYFYELWKSDGTETGTVRVAPNKVYNPENLTAANGSLFFKAFDFMYGTQLFKSDGTEAGTVSVSPGKVTLPYKSQPLVSINQTLFFNASDPRFVIAEELWQTDGTPGGTKLVKDIWPGSGSSRPQHLTNSNGKLFFVADDGITGKELWVFDPDACTSINEGNITVNNVSVCEGNNTALILNNSQTGVLYRAMVSGNTSFPVLFPFGQAVMGGGNVSLPLPTTNLEPGTYTIEIYASGCTEQKLPNTVTITVTALPEAPVSTPVTIYAGNQATLTVTGAAAGSTFRWYTQATAGTPVPGATSATYVTPVLIASATYYVSVVTNCGEGSRTAVSVTVMDSPCTASGSILREVWEDIPGTSLINVPFHTSPSYTSQLTLFEAPSNVGNNYGQRIRGYICPPQTGNYTFYIAGDDNCELWLSINDDPVNKVKIAHITGTGAWAGVRNWNKYTSQKSALVYLQAGQKYYIEALHKEGTLSDNLAVGWKLPTGTMERPIAGERLSPFVPTGSGSLLQEMWVHIRGVEVNQIPLLTKPASSSQITTFETPATIGNNYGQRIRGYVHPPVSGDYTFWIAGDDNCELWLSSDVNPDNKTRIAHISDVSGWTYSRQWNKFKSQKSAKVKLVAGRKYYVEVLHKEGTHGDHVAVGWQLPDYSLERPIAGIRLSPFTPDVQARIASRQAAQTNAVVLDVYPNPSQGRNIFLQVTGLNKREETDIIVYNSVGNTIAAHSFKTDENGNLAQELTFIKKLPAGIYTLVLQSHTHTLNRKIVITN